MIWLIVFQFSCVQDNFEIIESLTFNPQKLTSNGVDTCTIMIEVTEFLKSEFTEITFYSEDGVFIDKITKQGTQVFNEKLQSMDNGHFFGSINFRVF